MFELVLLPLMAVLVGAGVVGAIRLEATDPSLRPRESAGDTEAP